MAFYNVRSAGPRTRQQLGLAGALLASVILSLLLLRAGPLIPAPPIAAAPAPLLFTANAGQLDPAVRYSARGNRSTLLLTSDALWFSVVEPAVNALPTQILQGAHIRQQFVGANPQPRVEPLSALGTRVSFIFGSSSQTDVPTWSGVRYVDLYPQIDLEVTSQNGQIVQRLVARKGADLALVKLQLEGADAMRLDGDALRLQTPAGEFRLPLLELVADRSVALPPELPVLSGGLISAPFRGSSVAAVNQANTAATPALIYAARFGGSNYDRSYASAVDDQGALYISGVTLSANLPTTPGAFQQGFAGKPRDAFVAKLNPSGSAPVYITYIGGAGDDQGLALAIGPDRSVFLTGFTDSQNFPRTGTVGDDDDDGFPQRAAPRDDDDDDDDSTPVGAFVLKLNPGGTQLVYATVVRNGQDDRAYGIAVDKQGAAYIVGTTNGSFPFSANPADGLCLNTEAFVVKLNPSGTQREYATCLGGSGIDRGEAIAVDSSGAAYVVGATISADFPTTAGSFDPIYNGGEDIFLAKLAPNGSALVYSTYLGGTGDDITSLGNIALTATGEVFIAESTLSPDFPTTSTALDRSYNGREDMVVAGLSADGSQLLYSSFLGGSNNERPYQIGLLPSGAIAIGGETSSQDFPTTDNAFDRSYNGGQRDIFLTSFRTNGGQIDYSTYIGGSQDEAGGTLSVDGQGDLYLTGYTESSDFPRTVGAYNPPTQGGGDIFALKFRLLAASVPTNTPTNTPRPTNTPTVLPGQPIPPTFTPTRIPTNTPISSPTQEPGTTVQPTVDVPATQVPQPGVTQEPSLPLPPAATPEATSTVPPAAPAPRADGPIFLPMVTRIDPPLLCSDIEDNDTPAQAKPISPIGDPCQASFRDDPEGEDDYYQITVSAGQLLQIDVTQMPIGADYDLILYTSGLAQLSVSNRSGVASERVIYTATADGSLLIRVNMARESTSATNNYTLQVQVR
ncbi:MAG: SBBP repeat-containing protein [Roseiflexaceae bacterium]|nr:SBBP repeat-containing protein [Roseiflexaceae bacterium]